MANAGKNLIQLNGGIATPFVKIDFDGWGSITIAQHPRYFVSLNHVRNTDKACVATFVLKYIPETFEKGQPTDLDIMLMNMQGRNDTVTYVYGFYDCYGRLHVQQCYYKGRFEKYKADFDITTATVTYTFDVYAKQVDFLNTIISTEASKNPMQPSKYLEVLFWTHDKFKELANYYNTDINTQRDMIVQIPSFTNVSLTDFLLGTVQRTDGNNGNVVRTGGLVSLAKTKTTAYQMGEQWTNLYNEASQYANEHSGIIGNALQNMYNHLNTTYNKTSPYVCYFDDISINGKFGTIYFRPKEALADGSTGGYFINLDENGNFEYGNNIRTSVVQDFSVQWDSGAVSASFKASEQITNGIDIEGNNVGVTNNSAKLLSLGNNVYTSIAKFKRDATTSMSEIYDKLTYPFKASLKILGELYPHHLLDTIYIVVYMNGTEHRTLSGLYQILSVSDELGDSYFYTNFELLKITDDEIVADTETFIGNSFDGKSVYVDANLRAANLPT